MRSFIYQEQGRVNLIDFFYSNFNQFFSNLFTVPNCDIILHSSTSKNGSIQSPMYPGTYPAKTYCRYEFQGRGREKIQITFTEFNLPNDNEIDECEESDTLQIYVPMKGRYENVERLCGDTVPKPIMSNGPKMRLEFRGTRSGKGNRGFRADYTFLESTYNFS